MSRSKERLVKHYHNDKSELREWLSKRRQHYLGRLDEEAEKLGFKPFERSTSRCATVYAAGCLASKYDILPWSRAELCRAIMACQLDGAKQTANARGKSDNVPIDLREKVITYLREHHQQFVDLDHARLDPGAHQFGSVPGYVATFKGQRWLYVTADQLEQLIGDGRKADQLKKELANSGEMTSARSGQTRRYVVQRPIFRGQKGNKGHRRVHAFHPRILEA